jgi:hypothetical protein
LSQPKIQESLGAVALDACRERIVGCAAGVTFFGGIDTGCGADKYEPLDLVGVGKGDVKGCAPAHRITHPQRWPAYGADQQVGSTP